MTRREAIDRLLETVPVLHMEGWVLTPFNTLASDDGVVTLVMRADDEALCRELLARLHQLQPDLAVRFKVDSGARHVVFKL